MANIRKWLEEVEKAYGEPIEAVVVGPHDKRPSKYRPLADENVVLSREDGLQKLDQEYDNGYGGADCFPTYAWTKSRVFFVHEYDGTTGIHYAPRSPTAIEPEFSGQDPDLDAIRKRKAAKLAE